MDQDERNKLGELEKDVNENENNNSNNQSDSQLQPVKFVEHGKAQNLDLDQPLEQKQEIINQFKEGLKKEEETIKEKLGEDSKQTDNENVPNFKAKPSDSKKTIRYPEKALCIISSKNKLRIHCVYVVNNKLFESILTFCIVVNSVNIATGDYAWRMEEGGTEPSDDFRFYLGRVITFIFIGEFILKLIAMGFAFGKGAYLKDNWNKLDFVVVATGIWGILFTGYGNTGAIRTIRLLRPLRSINKVRGIRVIVSSLIDSLPPLANVALFLFFIIILFGTFGLHLFYGSFEWRCRTTPTPVNGQWDYLEGWSELCNEDLANCPEDSYCGSPFLYDLEWDQSGEVEWDIEFNYYLTNFDNIIESMLTIFQSMTGEGWSTMMYILWKHHNRVIVFSFFTFLILFGVFFVLNLFLAVISDSFSKVNQIEDNARDEKKAEQEKMAKMFLLNKSQKLDQLKRRKEAKKKKKSQKQLDQEEQKFLLKKGVKKEGEQEQAEEEKEQAKLSKENKENKESIEEIDLGKERHVSEDDFESSSGESLVDDEEDKGSDEDDDDKQIKTEPEKEKWAKRVIKTNFFTVLTFLFIFGNTIVLACESYHATYSETEFLKQMNNIFTYLFTVEMCFKIYALGIKGYAREGFNLFDGILVVVSIFDLVIELIVKQSTGVGVLSVFRTLRLLRVFKLAKKLKGLQILLSAIFSTLGDIVYFVLLLGLYIFICALLGMEFYAYEVKIIDYDIEVRVEPTDPGYDEAVFPRLNFNDFPHSLITVFALLVNEDWNYVLYTYVKCANQKPLSYFYILFVVIIGNFILLQLFLAILIDNFSEASEDALKNQQEADEKFAEQKEKERQQHLKEHGTEKIEKLTCWHKFLNLFSKQKTPKEQEEERKKQIKLKQLDYDPLCKSIYLGKSMWFDKKNKSDLNDNSNETSTKNDAVLYLIMQRRRNSAVKGTGNSFGQVKQEKAIPQGNSIFCLKPDNCIRKFFFALAVSTFSLVFQNPTDNPDATSTKFFKILDQITTMVFTLECLIKICAFGFIICGPTSYLRSWANVFDFVIVLAALLSMGTASEDSGGGATQILGKLKTLRVLRVIRPLRLISRSVQLKIAINALIVSVPQMINLFILCILFFFLFGIFGVSKFKGTYYYCAYEHVDLQEELWETEILTAQDCMNWGGDWLPRDTNFDNIIEGMLAMFKVALTEGWLDIMAWGDDIVGIEKVSKIDNQLWPALFFSIFIVIGSFFILNLFDGIVIDNFNNERNKHNGLEEFSNKQRNWIMLQQYVANQLPKINVPKPHQKWKLIIFKFVNTNTFEAFIMSLIVINMMIFMAHKPRQDPDIAQAFDSINIVFLIIFLIEATLKLLCMGKLYFKDPYNVFDFTILSITVVSMALSWLSLIESNNQTSILRIFRLGRALRLVNKAQSLRMIFNTFLITLPALANIGLLLLLIQFIYTILGVEMYWNLQRQDNINIDANFENFSNSFITLFRVSTGEGWNFIMDDMLRQQGCNYLCRDDIKTYSQWMIYGNQQCGSNSAYFYMISYQFIFAIIVINLFVAVILEGFDNTSRLEDANLSDLYLEKYKSKWAEYDPKAKGLIKVQELIYFLCIIDLPFDCDSIYILMMKMYLPVIQENPVKGQKNQNYFLFADVISAITHISTEKNIRNEELRKMNMKNKLQHECEALRTKMLKGKDKDVVREQTIYDSSYYILIKQVTKCWQVRASKIKRRKQQQEQKLAKMLIPPISQQQQQPVQKVSKSRNKKVDGG